MLSNVEKRKIIDSHILVTEQSLFASRLVAKAAFASGDMDTAKRHSDAVERLECELRVLEEALAEVTEAA